MIGIYKITSPNNRSYIGQSVNIEIRFNTYKKLKCNSQPKIYKSFLKYGIQNHKFEIIEECNIDLLNERERYWQDFYNCVENGLNCLLTKTNDLSGKLSQETKNKIGRKKDNHWCWGKKRIDVSQNMILKNPMFLEQNKNKVSEKLKGRKLNLETKNKMSLSRTGYKNINYKAILSFNKITKESFILGLKETSLHFKVDRELISNRLNNVTKNNRKLKEWVFTYEV